MKELKIQISDYKAIEELLKKIGGELYDVKQIVDTYFKTENPNDVLKTAEYNNTSFFLEKLKKDSNGAFEIISEEKINSVEMLAKKKKDLKSTFGIKRILTSERHYFRFSAYEIIINLISGIGEFLILTGENISEEIITIDLQINNPKFIRVPFSEL